MRVELINSEASSIALEVERTGRDKKGNFGVRFWVFVDCCGGALSSQR